MPDNTPDRPADTAGLTPEQLSRGDAVIAKALELPRDERRVFVERSCRDDPAVAAEVMSHLAHLDRDASTAFLEKPAALPPTPEPLPTRLPDRIGHYRIRSVLGAGGMGRVYLAQQDHPRRMVALKVMKSGVASRNALRRFEYESQILARLRHPNIGQVYEAGTHDDGSGGVPYFAMEYVPGAKTLIEHAEQKRLSTRDRLVLFAKVCNAVHHGHTKGVIHRDLKPGNVLVDSSGEPKIIDFGVARATDSDMAVTTLQTDIGQLIGTLQYMSPEQCDADPHDIDTRSDVYALGVVLYELLCGQLPYDLQGAAVYEAARVIREETPARPSTMNRALRGDIETITLKAMEKERDRRYRSAEALAADIRRYLDNEPIDARPPSLMYQTAVFARRNKVVFGALTSIAAVLVLATVVSLIFAVQSRVAKLEADEAGREAIRERDEAEKAREELVVAKAESDRQRGLAETRQHEAETARDEAAQQAEIAREVNAFLNTELLGAADPEVARGRDITVKEVLDIAAGRLDAADALVQPFVEAQLRQTIGDAYSGLAQYERAVHHLKRALELREDLYGDESLEVAESLESLALSLPSAAATAGLVDGVAESAVSAAERGLAIREKLLGKQHPLTVRQLGDLAMVRAMARGQPAAGLDEYTLSMVSEMRGKNETPAELREHYENLMLEIEADWARGLEAEVLALLETELEPALNEPVWAERVPLVCAGYAQLLRQNGLPNAALAMAMAGAEIGARHFGETQPFTIYAIGVTGQIYLEEGELDKAAVWCERALGLGRDVVTFKNPYARQALNNMGWVRYRQGRYDEAAVHFMEFRRESARHTGPRSHDTLLATNNLAMVHHALKQYEEAEALYRSALRTSEEVFGGPREGTIQLMHGLAEVLRDRGDLDEARALAESCHARAVECFGEEEPRTRKVVRLVVSVCETQGDAEAAAAWRSRLGESMTSPAGSAAEIEAEASQGS